MTEEESKPKQEQPSPPAVPENRRTTADDKTPKPGETSKVVGGRHTKPKS